MHNRNTVYTGPKVVPILTTMEKKLPSAAELAISQAESQEAALQDQFAKLKEQQDAIEKKRQDAADQLRTERINRRNELIADAETLRLIARDAKDSETALAYIKDAKTAEAEAAELASLLGISVAPVRPEEEPLEENNILSTTKGIWGLIAWVVGTALLFWGVGTSLVQAEDNDSASRMMNSVGLRLITNVLPFALTFLAVIVTLKLLFPDQYRYWNNRVQSQFSLQQDLQSVEPWQRIAFFSFCVALPAWAFVQLMQVIFG